MKTYKQITEEIANTASSGAIMGMGYNKDPLDVTVRKRKKKKRKKFAGHKVFEVTTEEFMNCNHGRKKYERWDRKLDMENFANQEIREYAHRNPRKPLVIMDEKYGTMSYLIPPTMNINEDVVRRGDKWLVISKAGEVLGTHNTKESAREQLNTIELNK
jgi:hypothetical protein